MYWCTSGVGLQVLPFIDNMHSRSIIRFHRFSCFGKKSKYVSPNDGRMYGLQVAVPRDDLPIESDL